MHWKKTRTRTKIGATAVAAVVTGALTFTALTQVPATAVQPVTDSMRIDHFLPAVLDPTINLADAIGGWQAALADDPDSGTFNQSVVWGWIDPLVKPKLRINSGDTVAIETMMHSHNLVVPTLPMGAASAPAGGDTIVGARKANPGGGPHSLTGPVEVVDARRGDVMEIRIKKIITKGFGANFNLPGGPGSPFTGIGALNDLAFTAGTPDAPGFVKYFFFEPDRRVTEFKPGVNLRLKPFPGTLALGIDPFDCSPRRDRTTGLPEPVLTEAQCNARKAGAGDDRPVSSLRPWKNGSNMDLNELGEGSTVYIPVLHDGAAIWTGDSHCLQGNGEINLTALECSYDQIVLQPVLHKDMDWRVPGQQWRQWPMAETKTHWILMGFADGTEKDVVGAGPLDKAFRIAAENTIEFLAATQGLTRLEAYSLTSMVGDCRVTQVVDIRRGVHCMIPKSIFKNRQTS